MLGHRAAGGPAYPTTACCGAVQYTVMSRTQGSFRGGPSAVYVCMYVWSSYIVEYGSNG